jgi:GT2 family glycosyltransferase
MPAVSVIILNWNGSSHLPECLASLKNQTYQNFECIVVDNGSQDASVNYLKTSHPWVRLIELDSNKGFAAGNNIGYSRSSGRFVVTLNNDTAVDEKWVQELVNVAEEDPNTGMVASRICNYYEPDVIDSLGMKICLDGMSRGAFRGCKFSELRSVPDSILLPSACAALYRREMLEQIGFFAEEFFAYCEDTDLGLRAIRAGWKSRLAVDAIVYHKYSATAGSFSPLKLFLVERNHFWTAVRNFPSLLILLLPVTTLMRYIMQLIAISGNRGAGAVLRSDDNKSECVCAVLKAVWAALTCPAYLISSRTSVKNKRTICDAAFLKILKKFRLKFSELLDMT